MFGGSEHEESVDIGIVSTVDVVCSEVVGTEDDMQHFLCMVLCDHDNPRDQSDSNSHRQQQQQQAAIASASISLQHSQQP